MPIQTTSNQPLNPPYTLAAGDCYASIIAAAADKSEADQRSILLAIGGRIGGELVELYDISRSIGQSREAAFRGAIEEYQDYLQQAD